MGLVLNYTTYFTHFSFLLFIINFILPFTYSLKFIILLNSIIVGIVGNILFIMNYSDYVEWYKDKYPDKNNNDMYYELGLSNFIFHTLPMIVAFFLIMGTYSFVNNTSDIIKYTYYLIILKLIWSMLPDKNNNIGFDKLNNSYNNVSIMLISTLLSILLSLIFLYGLHKK
jgi:hypothetical protein